MVLKVRPVINSGSRIDLDISQEVSNARLTQTGVDSSPTIFTRKIDTKLSLRDGSTVMLAGLITNDNSQSESGVPLLKDIPGVGAAFKTNTVINNKTEMVILITPYIINDDFEAESITKAFQGSLGEWANNLRENFESRRLRPKTPDEGDLAHPGKPLAPAEPGTPGNAPPQPQLETPPQDAAPAAPATDKVAPPALPNVVPEGAPGTAPRGPLPMEPKAAPPNKIAPPASLDKNESVIPDGVIMSKPQAPVAASPVAAPGAKASRQSGRSGSRQKPAAAGRHAPG